MGTKIRKKLSFCFLISVLSVSLCGCRESDEIAKLIYTEDAAEAGDRQRIQPDHSDEVDTASSETMESSEADAKKTKKTPKEGDQGNSGDAADSTGGAQEGRAGDGSNQAEAPDGNPDSEAGEDDTERKDDPETGEVEDDTEEEDGWEDSSDTESDDPAPDPEDETNPENPNDSSSENGEETGRNEDDENSRQVYDKDGNVVDLPAEVGRIAAPGEAGLIVQMLGGEGVLCASSDSFLDNSVAQSVFADEGIADVAHLWPGDGSAPMDEGSFAALLAMEPDCCIGVSGQANFSSEQIGILKKNNIAYVLIPSMNSPSNIETAVQITGEILGGHEVGGTTSNKLAQAYVDYEQALVNGIASGQEPLRMSTTYSMHTTVLWDWDPGFRYEYYQNGGGPYISQSGGAVVKLYDVENEDTPVSYYMGAADVNDNSRGAMLGNIYCNSPQASVFVPIYWLLMNNDTRLHINAVNGILQEGSQEGGIGEEDSSIEGELINAWMAGSSKSYSYLYVKGIYDTYYSDISRVLVSLNRETDPYDIRLGNERFPCVIAATNEIKANVEASKADPLGLYRIRPWGIEVPGIEKPYTEEQMRGAIEHFGYSEEPLNFVNTVSTSRWDYDIYVNPYGAGDWLFGSVESFLETAWVRNLFFGEEVYSSGEMERVIREFYQIFYRCDDAPIGDILDGI